MTPILGWDKMETNEPRLFTPVVGNDKFVNEATTVKLHGLYIRGREIDIYLHSLPLTCNNNKVSGVPPSGGNN